MARTFILAQAKGKTTFCHKAYCPLIAAENAVPVACGIALILGRSQAALISRIEKGHVANAAVRSRSAKAADYAREINLATPAAWADGMAITEGVGVTFVQDEADGTHDAN